MCDREMTNQEKYRVRLLGRVQALRDENDYIPTKPIIELILESQHELMRHAHDELKDQLKAGRGCAAALEVCMVLLKSGDLMAKDPSGETNTKVGNAISTAAQALTLARKTMEPGGP